MLKDDVLRYFKNKRLVAEALGISRVAVVRWKTVIPKLRAMELDEITGGELKYNPELYKKKDTTKGERRSDS
ncbi:phage antirepressor protein Cro [Escherichia coli]|uniref:Cro/CI family transcriptional regulator n=1 Tax=Escherichia coli TaxID=562 RepID=UPI0010CC1121|nr:Cro/CI family transcriptional regulator [Escherichia coli]GDJ61582.1 phage antirepressor protein Cro [Escherichia coli]